MTIEKPSTRRAFILLGAGTVATIALPGCGRGGDTRSTGDTGATAPAKSPAAAAPQSGGLPQSNASGAPSTTPTTAPARVDETSGLAKSLNYWHDAAQVQDPKRQPDQFCDNCQFYLTAQAQGDWAPCPIFQNQQVAAKGWCTSWVKKT